MQNLIYINLVLVLCIFGCANPQPPSGGPADMTQPEIIYMFPQDGQKNFGDDKVIIGFNKYMNKNKVRENIFVQPMVKYDLTWSGRELEIEFKEALETNTTYAVIFGTDYTDIYNNFPAQSYSLIFSTGNSIDSGKIYGKLYGEGVTGAYIFAYRIFDNTGDTLNPSLMPSRIRTQVGGNGAFELRALKDGKYRIFAVGDKFKNGVIDEGVDRFGAFIGDVIVFGDSTPVVNIKLGGAIDKSGPLLYSAKQITNRIVQVLFSEDLDTSSISSSSFMITDTNQINYIKVLSANLSVDNPKKVDLVTGVALNPARWLLYANYDSTSVIRDSSGNKLQDTSISCTFVSIDIPDTIKPILTIAPLKDSALNIKRDIRFSFVFNTGIDTKHISDKIRLYNLTDSSVTRFRLNWKGDNHFIVIPEEKLANLSWYRLEFRVDSLFGMNGIKSIDTTYRYTFQTEDTRNYGSISGNIVKSRNYNCSYYVIIKGENNKNVYKVRVGNTGKWDFEELPAGDYSIEVFADLNENGRYDYGDYFPYKVGEPFVVVEQVISIKPRWELENFNIIFE